jgi:hypothetical protein
MLYGMRKNDERIDPGSCMQFDASIVLKYIWAWFFGFEIWPDHPYTLQCGRNVAVEYLDMKNRQELELNRQ